MTTPVFSVQKRIRNPVTRFAASGIISISRNPPAEILPVAKFNLTFVFNLKIFNMITKNVEKAINEQIKREEHSSRIYLSMASWAERNGYPGAANWL